MSAEVRPTIVELWPVPEADELTSKVARAGYLQRRRYLHLQVAPPRWPRFIYKFRELKRTEPHRDGDPIFTPKSINVLRTVLVDSLLWLSSPEDFNDPFDTWVSWTVEGTDQQKMARLRALAEEHLAELTPQQREAGLRNAMQTPHDGLVAMLLQSFAEQRRRFGVCCFAGDPRDVLMWSHYAGSHTGVCLQFETSCDPPVFMRALPVAYVDQSPMINWLMGNFQREVGEAFTRKHIRWRYEAEHRIIQRDRAGCCVRFAPGALTGLIFGCKADADVKRAVRQLLYERAGRGLPRVKLYYARQHEQRNEVQIWGIEDGTARASLRLT
jgi:hypothetical protein